MKDVDAPIIPVCLDNVWGSIFSYEKGRFLWKVPRYIPYPVTVSFGKPMPPTATPFEVRQAVQDLNTDAWHASPQDTHAAAAPRVRPQSPASSVAVLHGRCPHAEPETSAPR